MVNNTSLENVPFEALNDLNKYDSQKLEGVIEGLMINGQSEGYSANGDLFRLQGGMFEEPTFSNFEKLQEVYTYLTSKEGSAVDLETLNAALERYISKSTGGRLTARKLDFSDSAELTGYVSEAYRIAVNKSVETLQSVIDEPIDYVYNNSSRVEVAFMNLVNYLHDPKKEEFALVYGAARKIMASKELSSRVHEEIEKENPNDTKTLFGPAPAQDIAFDAIQSLIYYSGLGDADINARLGDIPDLIYELYPEFMLYGLGLLTDIGSEHIYDYQARILNDSNGENKFLVNGRVVNIDLPFMIQSIPDLVPNYNPDKAASLITDPEVREKFLGIVAEAGEKYGGSQK